MADHSEKCPTCAGRGRIETGEMENGPGGLGFQTVDCEKCAGTGEVTEDDADLLGYQYGTTIQFRGAPRLVFYDYEGDHVIIWWLIGDDATNGPSDATDSEVSAIYAQLWSEMEDRWAWSAEQEQDTPA